MSPRGRKIESGFPAGRRSSVWILEGKVLAKQQPPSQSFRSQPCKEKISGSASSRVKKIRFVSTFSKSAITAESPPLCVLLCGRRQAANNRNRIIRNRKNSVWSVRKFSDTIAANHYRLRRRRQETAAGQILTTGSRKKKGIRKKNMRDERKKIPLKSSRSKSSSSSV